MFGQAAYEPLARLSGVLAIALLAGGLAVLVLDLGRPDRLVVAMTHYNFSSVFAWNVLLYTGFMAAVAVYLWMRMERRMHRYARPAGIVALVWRIVLTTGTGCIFGFLVARQAYDAAIMAPLFVATSFSLGSAVFILVLLGAVSATARPLDDRLLHRLARLQAIFVSGVLYFVLVRHLANLYVAEHVAVERFPAHRRRRGRVSGGLLGRTDPRRLHRTARHPVGWRADALAEVDRGRGGTRGGWRIQPALRHHHRRPGRPAPHLPRQGGHRGRPHRREPSRYLASAPELLLGLGGVAVSLLILVLAIRVLRILPERFGGEDDAGGGPRASPA